MNEQSRLALAVAALLAVAPATAQHQHAEHAPAPSAVEQPAPHAEHGQHAEPALAPLSAEDRAAAFPDLGAMRMNDMMLENPLNKLVLLDRFEWQNASGGDALDWDLDAWIGRDLAKVWFRSEGARSSGTTERAELEVLWGRGIARWWELVAGARRDFAPGDEQSWAAIGVHGMAPYRFDVEATAYVGNGASTALRIETKRDLLVTNRLILSPLLEVNWHGQTDTARGVGAGLSDAEIGLRLRYEIRREIAPYVGLSYERSFGRTADLVSSAGDDTSDTRLVAGLRVWF
jgi:copper resistance protein B